MAGTDRGRPIRVAYFVSPSDDFAGIERVVHEIATGLATGYPDEFEVHVLYSTHYDEGDLLAPAYIAHDLGADRLLAVPGRLRQVLRRIQPDVLVAPQIEASVICWTASRRLGIRAFFTHLHGNPIVEEQRGTRRTKLAFSFFRWIMRRHVDAVLAVAPTLGAFARTSLARGVPVHYVPNPVRTLAQRPAARLPGPFRFVSVGRLAYQKGQDLAIRALAGVAEELPSSVLTLVGDGAERPTLEALAAELGVADRVEFAGYVADPSQLLQASDCFVLSSRWEGFGVALVEALQYGLPLIATDCRFGPSDIIVDPEIGELVPAEDVRGLGAAMVRAATAPRSESAVDRRRAVAASYEPGTACAAHARILRGSVAVKRWTEGSAG